MKTIGKCYCIDVNDDNYQAIKDAYSGMFQDRNSLIDRLKKYPVELVFADHRFLMSDRDEFNYFMMTLKFYLDRHRKSVRVAS